MYRMLAILLIFVVSMISLSAQELVYAEMEFPLGFLSFVDDYRFDPLGHFQTEIEGRIIELTADPLVDMYEISPGRQVYRPCLAGWQNIEVGNRKVLNFSLENVFWSPNQPLTTDDVLFSFDYRRLNKSSLQITSPLTLNIKGSQSLDASYSDAPQITPSPGEFTFPLVNRVAFRNSSNPQQAIPDKRKISQIGYGRYQIANIEENQYIQFNRRLDHPYYQNLQIPEGYQPIDKLRMQAFPRAILTRNTQFIEGRVHLLTSVLPNDRGQILNSAPNTKVCIYPDDSFTGFLFNCRHSYLQHSAIRRALNYAFRKNPALQKLLYGEGELVSGPIPKRNFCYNLDIPVYEDNPNKALITLQLYHDWGIDVYEDGKRLIVANQPNTSGPSGALQQYDQILAVENTPVQTLSDLVEALSDTKQNLFRIRVVREQRISIQRIQRNEPLPQNEIQQLTISNSKVSGFPTLVLIANNPEGKNPLVKEICGTLKEDLAFIGIDVKIDYLENQDFYSRMQKGDFDLALRTMKITGTPNLFLMFYNDKNEVAASNYGNYRNTQINELAFSIQNSTDLNIIKEKWKFAHEILHYDPPFIFLWSRNYIILHNPQLEVIKPVSPEYKIPYGYTKINGLINVFNEIHLWAWKK